MSSDKINIGSLASEIMKVMEDYENDVAIDMKQTAKKIANKGVKELKWPASPVGHSENKHYASGWTAKTNFESSTSISISVHNKLKPGLAHLLEHGHAKRNGGRVGAQVHIAPIEQEMIKEYEDELKARLSK